MGRLTIINDTLAIEVLMWPGDISQPKPVSVSPSERASALMDKIVDSMTTSFDVDQYKHQFRDILAEAEKARVPGDGGIAIASLPKRAQKKDEDFFSLLEQVAEGSVKARKPKSA
jgi:non-homologous end joining protein Ku